MTPGRPILTNIGTTQRAQSLSVQRILAWSGPLFMVTMGIGFVLLGKMVPPPAATNSAAQTAQFFLGNLNQIRLGMIVSGFSAALLVPFAAVLAVQMWRIEGRYPVLTLIQFGSGTLLSFEFIYLYFFWQAAAYRKDRPPELMQLLNDMAWLPFVGLLSTVIIQAATIGWVVLLDKRERPVFPRWFGYFQIWAALLFTPGSFNVYFRDGILSRGGVISFYLPLTVFTAWIGVTSVLLFRAIAHQELEESDIGVDPDLAALAAEVARLLRSDQSPV